MKEADAVTQTTPLRNATAVAPAPAQPSSGLRAPIDRTHAVMDQVRQRAAEPF